jgi:hypothetical protein
MYCALRKRNPFCILITPLVSSNSSYWNNRLLIMYTRPVRSCLLFRNTYVSSVRIFFLYSFSAIVNFLCSIISTIVSCCFLSVFMWPLNYLSFDLRFLIIPLYLQTILVPLNLRECLESMKYFNPKFCHWFK